MQPYKFKVKYEPGPSNIADPLWRLVGNLKSSSSHSAEADEYVTFVPQEVEEASAIDEELCAVKEWLNGKPLKKLKPTKNSTWPYLNKILAHFINAIKTKGYDVLGVNLFPHKLMGGMRFPHKKGVTLSSSV